MENLLLPLVALSLGAAMVAAWLASRSATEAMVERRLAASEQRLLGELERLRGAMRSSSREEASAQARAVADVERAVTRGFRELAHENTAQLEAVRKVVDDRLGTALEARLGESFRLVSERLEQVHRGLGEMHKLADGVGALERVLTNVRARGTFGETQLAALLAQMMSPEQYATNVVTVPGSNERVEFALKIPGGRPDDPPVLMPIDAKFPQEDYLRLGEAQDAGNAPAVDEARKALRRRVMAEAQRIHDKYVSPPHTTDFAILFVPTEGLYAEVLRTAGLAESIQARTRVMIAGPTTLCALLSSLQMGLRTLAIERRSGEVWKVLGGVKTEFGKFGASLDAVSRKLHEATSKLDETAQRSRSMQKQLRDVEAASEAAAPAEGPRLSLVPGDDSL